MAHHPQPEITGSDAGHICRVLRLSTGDAVELFDGSGKAYRAQIVSASPKRVTFTIQDTVDQLSQSRLRITLAQAMLKDRKMDDLIRQLTELGLDCWMPFYAARSVPVSGKKGLAKRLGRWKKIALEAVKQCRRTRIPQIKPMTDFDQLLHASEAYPLKIMFWEEAAEPFDMPERIRVRPANVLLVVGPEGGFDPAEVRRAKAQDFFTTGLGPRTLRAETAALAALALTQYCFGDMGRLCTCTQTNEERDDKAHRR
jgi:16S rRNA (uracil1498-N3)-methyltransferase